MNRVYGLSAGCFAWITRSGLRLFGSKPCAIGWTRDDACEAVAGPA